MMRLGRCGEEDEEVVSMFGFAKKSERLKEREGGDLKEVG